ncbi:MAG: glycosyltransferase family 39 protein [Candidatus Hydrogenedentales bacterium]|jgi:4-amino-4-deoxy-L-arabinose transferase-like glycosyltransferase
MTWKRIVRTTPPFALVLAITVVLVSPLDAFPLNDDWVYATMVQWHLDGHFAVHPYSSAFALTQTVWGALWCLVFGYSYGTLRISTLALAALAAWATSRAAREAGAGRRLSRMAGVVLVCNPLFLNLAYTFMTDVPFMACLAVSVLFHLRLLRRGHAKDAAVASVFACAAFLDRQFGVVVPIVFAAALAVTWRRNRVRIDARTTASYIAPWLAALPIGLWLTLSQEMEFYPREAVLYARAPGVAPALGFGVGVAITLGLFLLPFAVCRGPRWSQRQWFAFAGASGVLLGMLPMLGPLPHFPNLLRDFGVGPLLLRDATVFHPGWSPITAGPVLWWPVTLAAALGGSVFIARVLGGRSKSVARNALAVRKSQRAFLLLLALALIVTPCVPAHAVYFDRYLLAALAPLLVFAAAASGPSLRGCTWVVAMCALSYAFGVASLQDCLAWNRARWQAIEILRVVHNVPDTQIDGGYEFNGLFTSDAYMARLRSGEADGMQGWWVVDDAYAVSFQAREGYEEIDHVAYSSWLGFARRDVLILKRSR